MIIKTVFLTEFLHDTVDFLALTWETEAREHAFEGLNIGYTIEVERINILVEDFLVHVDVFS